MLHIRFAFLTFGPHHFCFCPPPGGIFFRGAFTGFCRSIIYPDAGNPHGYWVCLKRPGVYVTSLYITPWYFYGFLSFKSIPCQFFPDIRVICFTGFCRSRFLTLRFNSNTSLPPLKIRKVFNSSYYAKHPPSLFILGSHLPTVIFCCIVGPVGGMNGSVFGTE